MSRRATVLDRANNLPKRRPLSRPFTQWDGQPRSVLGPISGFCVRPNKTHGQQLDSLPSTTRRTPSLTNPSLLVRIKKTQEGGRRKKRRKKHTLYKRTSSGNLAFCARAHKHGSTLVRRLFCVCVAPRKFPVAFSVCSLVFVSLTPLVNSLYTTLVVLVPYFSSRNSASQHLTALPSITPLAFFPQVRSHTTPMDFGKWTDFIVVSVVSLSIHYFLALAVRSSG